MQDEIFDNGWIGLYRSVLKHWIYPQGRPFTKYEAWVDLLLMVNFEDKKVFTGEDLIDCSKGEVITSQLKLMNRWRWSKSKLLKFFSVLEIDKMCAIKSDNKKTSIKICNYINYQDFKQISKNKKTTKKTVDDTTKRLQKDTTKEDKEVKNVIYSEFYDLEIKNNPDQDYLNFVKFLFGENDLGRPFNKILKMDDQIGYLQFINLRKVSEETGIKIYDTCRNLENYTKKNYLSFYLTLNNWLKNVR